MIKEFTPPEEHKQLFADLDELFVDYSRMTGKRPFILSVSREMLDRLNAVPGQSIVDWCKSRQMTLIDQKGHKIA